MSRANQDAHLAQVGQALLQAPWREPTTFPEAIGLLLHEPELVVAWCRHAQSMDAGAWRRLASAAGRAAQKAARPPKREDAESFLHHVGRQCRNAAVDCEQSGAAPPRKPPLSSQEAVPRPSPTSAAREPAPPLSPAGAPPAPPAVGLESLAQQWAAAESPLAQDSALDALLAALGAPPEAEAAYVATVAEALRAAGACGADAGWRLHAALCARHARPSLQTVARSLLTLSAPLRGRRWRPRHRR